MLHMDGPALIRLAKRRMNDVLRSNMILVFVVAALSFAPGPARSSEAAWCAVADIGWGSADWDCQYYSLEECVHHILAGNRGFCSLNPRYNAAPSAKRRHQLHRR